MAAVIYSLCALTSLSCFALLFRGYRTSGNRLLFWSAFCFAALSVNNLLLVVDKVFLPTEVDLLEWRLFAALSAVVLLLFGLVWEDD